MTYLNTSAVPVNPPRIQTRKTSRERWVDLVPYGRWVCGDGREVLFNRCYQPIWQRRPGAPAEPANPDEWVPWITQAWFWDDYDHPGRNRKTLTKVNKLLKSWGLPPLPSPPRV
jgi:hypothetical protein